MKNVIEILIKANDNASKPLGNVAGSLKKVHAQAVKGAQQIAMAGTAAAVGLFAVIKKTSEWGDTIAKTSKQLGVTTEFLSEFDYALQISGTSLNEAYGGVKRLSKAMSDANIGLETYKRVFDSMGVSVSDSEGNLRSLESVILDVADVFQNTENATQKAAWAQELFGRSGLKMIPLLNEGSAGIEKLRKKAVALGVSLNASAAKRAEEFVDSLTDIKTAIKGVGLAITEEFSEDIEEFAENLATNVIPKMRDWIKENKDATRTTVEVGGGITGLALSFLGLNAVINASRAHPVLALIVAALGLFAFAAKKGKGELENLHKEFLKTGDIEKSRAALYNWAKMTNINTGAAGAMADQLIKNWKTERKFNQEMLTTADIAEITGEKYHRHNDLLGYYNNLMKDATGHVKTRADLLAEETTRLNELIAKMERRNQLEWEQKTFEKPVKGFQALPKLKPQESPYNAAYENFNENWNKVKAELEQVPELVNPAAESVANMFHRFDVYSDDFATTAAGHFTSFTRSVLMDTAEIGEAFRNMIMSMVSDFLGMVVQMVAYRALIQAFGFGIPLHGGGEIAMPGAQYGAEITGGLVSRDSVPIIASSGEVVIPSPTVDKLNRFLDSGGTAQRPINLYPLFNTGSKHEGYKIAGYVAEKLDLIEPFTIEGVL